MFEKTKIVSVTPEQAVKYAELIKAAYDNNQIQMFITPKWIDVDRIGFSRDGAIGSHASSNLHYWSDELRVKPEPEVVKINKRLRAQISDSAQIGFWVTHLDGKLYDIEITMTEVV